jgi:hypothetical protein
MAFKAIMGLEREKRGKCFDEIKVMDFKVNERKKHLLQHFN